MEQLQNPTAWIFLHLKLSDRDNLKNELEIGLFLYLIVISVECTIYQISLVKWGKLVVWVGDLGNSEPFWAFQK